jgi:hypothetical protein
VCHHIGSSTLSKETATTSALDLCMHSKCQMSSTHWTLKGSVPPKLLAMDSYDYHVSNGALQWVETALRACPALYAGVG